MSETLKIEPIPFSLETLSTNFLTPTILQVELNRAKTLNAINKKMFSEIFQLFTYLNSHPLLRVVILTGAGKLFTSGLDLKEEANTFNFEGEDQARKAISAEKLVKAWQGSLSSLVYLRVPVIIGIHSYCIGGGVDIIGSGDIRYCTEDAKFSIKEVDIGMMADIGSFPRVQQSIMSESLARELALTGKVLNAEDALRFGLVSKVFKNKDELLKGLLSTAKEISDKSPVAIYSLKKVMNKMKFSKMEEILEYAGMINMSMIFTDDIPEAIKANITKRVPNFPKL